MNILSCHPRSPEIYLIAILNVCRHFISQRRPLLMKISHLTISFNNDKPLATRIPTIYLTHSNLMENVKSLSLEPVCFHILKALLKTKLRIFFYFFLCFKLYFLGYSDHFDVLMSKMNFKKWKNIISMYFHTKSTLKSKHYHNIKRALKMITFQIFTYSIHKDLRGY